MGVPLIRPRTARDFESVFVKANTGAVKVSRRRLLGGAILRGRVRTVAARRPGAAASRGAPRGAVSARTRK